MRKKLKPYHHEQKLLDYRPCWALSKGARISENHIGISVFADPEPCGHSQRPTHVLITWATIKAALRRKERHEI